jgi:polyphosphate kinase
MTQWSTEGDNRVTARSGNSACEREPKPDRRHGPSAASPEIEREALAATDLADPLVDRDLSWPEFNRRVLHEALDERTRLLERVKFLAIFSSNLDEFLHEADGTRPADDR